MSEAEDGGYIAKISDFGLSLTEVDKTLEKTKADVTLAFRWTAPVRKRQFCYLTFCKECLESHPSYSCKSDVWSMGKFWTSTVVITAGCVLYELFSDGFQSNRHLNHIVTTLAPFSQFGPVAFRMAIQKGEEMHNYLQMNNAPWNNGRHMKQSAKMNKYKTKIFKKPKIFSTVSY